MAREKACRLVRFVLTFVHLASPAFRRKIPPRVPAKRSPFELIASEKTLELSKPLMIDVQLLALFFELKIPPPSVPAKTSPLALTVRQVIKRFVKPVMACVQVLLLS